MAKALPAAAQPALDVSAPRAARPLTFFNSRSRHLYMATFRNHVFAIRRHDCTDRVIWSTTIVEIGRKIGIADAFADLGDAIDHLQRAAARMDAPTAPRGPRLSGPASGGCPMPSKRGPTS